ncbi:MAG: hypothetical protein AAB605_00070 [Patescibacteria group bacterium]
MDKIEKIVPRSEFSLKGIQEDVRFLRDNKQYFPTIREIVEIPNIYPPLAAANSAIVGMMLQGDIGPSDPYTRFFAVLGQAIAFNAVGARSALNSIVAYVKTKKVLLYHREKSGTEAPDVEQISRMLQRMTAKIEGPAARAGIEGAIRFCYPKETFAITKKLFPRTIF